MDGWPERRVFLGPPDSPKRSEPTLLVSTFTHCVMQYKVYIYSPPLFSSLYGSTSSLKFFPSYSFQNSSFLLHLQTKQGPSVHWHSLKREWHTQDCVGYHESMVKEGRVGGLLRKVWVLTWPVKLSSLATTLVAFSLFLSTLFLFYFILFFVSNLYHKTHRRKYDWAISQRADL